MLRYYTTRTIATQLLQRSSNKSVLLTPSEATISTAAVQLAKANTNSNSQARILGKLFGDRVSGSKRRWYPTNDAHAPQQTAIFSGATQLGKTSKQQGKATTRRMTVLNKLFMKHITDQLATGAVAEGILGRGLQVSRVKISPDFAYVNVFWMGGGSASDDATLEKELKRSSGLLRHELSQLGLMGEVPRINFVRDKTFSNLAQVESLLRQADYGEDFAHGDAAAEVKRDFHWKPALDVAAVDAAATTTNTLDTDLPEMRHDVLGLDHRGIMHKIHTKMRKSKQAWEQHEQGLHKLSSTDNTASASAALERIQQKLATAAASEAKFDKFLAKRRERKVTPERKQFRQAQDQRINMSAMDLSWEEQQLRDDDDYIDDEEPEQPKRS